MASKPQPVRRKILAARLTEGDYSCLQRACARLGISMTEAALHRNVDRMIRRQRELEALAPLGPECAGEC